MVLYFCFHLARAEGTQNPCNMYSLSLVENKDIIDYEQSCSCSLYSH